VEKLNIFRQKRLSFTKPINTWHLSWHLSNRWVQFSIRARRILLNFSADKSTHDHYGKRAFTIHANFTIIFITCPQIAFCIRRVQIKQQQQLPTYYNTDITYLFFSKYPKAFNLARRLNYGRPCDHRASSEYPVVLLIVNLSISKFRSFSVSPNLISSRRIGAISITVF